MFNPGRRLIVDLKAQNRLREWFARIADPNRGCDKITCIQFGDSDVDYNLGFDYTKIRVLNAPYNVESIKNRLAYTGITQGVDGVIRCYARYVTEDGDLMGYYDYPNNTVLSLGIVPPTLLNALDKTELILENDSIFGWMGFIETLPNNYFDSNGNQLRLVEPYEITLNCTVDDVVLETDLENGSFLLGVNEILETPGSTIGTIVIRGTVSGLSKTISLKIAV